MKLTHNIPMDLDDTVAGPATATRCTAWAVTVTYLVSLFLPQLASAAATAGRNGPSAAEVASHSVSAEDRQSEQLHGLRATLGAMRTKAHAKKDVSKEKKSLEAVRKQLQETDQENVSKLAEVKTFLAGKGVPQVILERQDKVARHLADESAHLQQALAAVEQLNDSKAMESALAQLQTEVAGLHTGRAHAPLDPHNLPFGVPHASPRAANSSTAMLQEQHPDDAGRRYLFAGVAGAGVTGQVAPTDPTYVAANAEVQITQAIKSQAAALNNDPVAIFNWVRNNIDYSPTYGAMQGSDQTLQALRGNAYDTASLLIALLRAAGVPARYVYGTVQMPITQVMSWAGGFDNPQAAVDFLGQGGIPISALGQGGTIQSVLMEHVWVEAWVSYLPSRGTKAHGSSSWVPMDASFKSYQDVAGITPTTATPDLQAAVQTYLASAKTSNGGDSSTGYDPTAFNTYKANLAGAMAPTVINNPSLVLSNQVLPTRTIVAAQSPLLPATLPYHLVARGGDYASLPSSLKVSAEVDLYTLDDEMAGNSPLISQQVSLSEMGFSSLELTYAPATAADASAWAAYQNATSFPAYLIQVKASLKLAGNDLQDSGAMPIGQDMVLHVVYGGAAQPRDARFAMSSGDESQVSLDGAGQAASLGLAFNGRTDLGTAENNLFVASKAFWMQADEMDTQIAQISRVAYTRMPSAGTFSSPVSIVYNYGIPFKASYHGHAVDVKLAQYSAMSRDGDPQKTQTFALISGMQMSSQEDTVLDEVFGSPLGHGVSTMGLIALANSTGMPIYHITGANWGTYRGALQQPDDVFSDIDNAINAGLEVVIPQSQLTNQGWTGSGYIMLDPVSGAGDYRINGGASGSFSDSCGRQSQPIAVKVPDVSPIWNMILGGLVDEDLNFNGTGVAEVLALVAATAVLIVVAGPAALMAAAAIGRGAAIAALVLSVGYAELVAAADDDTCSCTPQNKPRRGGNAFHNACADLPAYTSFPGVDRLLDGRYYDGQVLELNQMTEVKTGTFYTTIANIADTRPSAGPFKAALLAKEIALIVGDTGIAGICSLDYGYYTRDSRLLSDLQSFLLALASKVHPASCGP